MEQTNKQRKIGDKSRREARSRVAVRALGVMIYVLLETCKGSDNSVPIVLRRNELTIDVGLQDHGL